MNFPWKRKTASRSAIDRRTQRRALQTFEPLETRLALSAASIVNSPEATAYQELSFEFDSTSYQRGDIAGSFSHPLKPHQHDQSSNYQSQPPRQQPHLPTILLFVFFNSSPPPAQSPSSETPSNVSGHDSGPIKATSPDTNKPPGTFSDNPMVGGFGPNTGPLAITAEPSLIAPLTFNDTQELVASERTSLASSVDYQVSDATTDSVLRLHREREAVEDTNTIEAVFAEIGDSEETNGLDAGQEGEGLTSLERWHREQMSLDKVLSELDRLSKSSKRSDSEEANSHREQTSSEESRTDDQEHQAQREAASQRKGNPAARGAADRMVLLQATGDPNRSDQDLAMWHFDLGLVAERDTTEGELPAGIYQCFEVGVHELPVTVPTESTARSAEESTSNAQVALTDADAI